MTGRRRSSTFTAGLALVGTVVTGAVTAAAAPAQALGDGAHGFGRMGPALARITSVDPASGPDFEMPFVCGQSWTGTTRSSHSPSAWTIDWNTPEDLGKPALSSAPGVVTRAVTLTGSYGRYVVVDHGGGWSTLYAHLDQIVATVGQVVDQGDLLGYVGGSGNVTGPHLHHEERKDGAYFHPYLHRALFPFGATRSSANCTDRPLAGDWDGDGRADIGLYRNTPTASVVYTRPASGATAYRWGTAGDVPVSGDWDGDGTTQVGVRPLGSSTWVLRGRYGNAVSVRGVGLASDLPVTGDWDGDGRTDLGYYRSATHTFYLRSLHGTITAVPWGSTGDQPVTGDWDGDGRTDLGAFDPATRTWTLRVPSGSSYVTQQVLYGGPGDSAPITGDWDGDHRTDLGVWRLSSARFYQRTVDAGSSRAVSTYVAAWGHARG
jgi:hypothetical protein